MGSNVSNPGVAGLANPQVFPMVGAVSATAPAVTGNVLFVCEMFLPIGTTLTGVEVACATAVGNVITALYNAAGTSLLGSSASTALVSTTSQRVPFSSPYVAAAGTYFLASIFSAGATMYSFLPLVRSAAPVQGGFSVPANISVPSVQQTLAIVCMNSY